MSQLNEQKIFCSHQLKLLAGELRVQLFSDAKHPLEKRVIIVPSNEVKRYLMDEFLKDSRFRLAAGFQIFTPDQAIAELFTLSGLIERPKVPTQFQLGLLIQDKLGSSINPDIEEYIGSGEKLSFTKLGALSLELTPHFINYGIHPVDELSLWRQKTGYQQHIWDAIFEKDSEWTYPIRQLQREISLNFTIHLFHCADLPEAYLRFFMQLNAVHYLFSPCLEYWGDLQTSREKYRESEMDDALSDFHPLLSNYGKMGRHNLDFFLDHSQGFHMLQDDATPVNELTLLQRDLRDLDSFELSGKDESIKQTDHSIQCVSAPNKRREVEVLHDHIVHLLNQENEKLEPSQITVYATNMKEYVSHIHAVFSSREPKIPFKITNIPALLDNAHLSGFKSLISLPQERFDKAKLMSLLSSPQFMQQRAIDGEMVAKFQKFIELSKITWGVDQNHKKIALNTSLEGASSGTFAYGIEKLMSALVMYQNAHDFSIEMTESETLGKFIETVEMLAFDLNPILSGKKMKGSEWCGYLVKIGEKYFGSSLMKSSFMTDLKKIALEEMELKVPFSSMMPFLERHFDRQKSESFSPGANRVTFAPYQTSYLRPNRMICVLGLDEESFPQKEAHSPLSEMNCGPQRSDVDKFLWLYTLCFAEKQLYLSHLAFSEKDGKELGPSPAIVDTLEYLSKRLSFSIPIRRHPLHPFNRSYFLEGGKLSSPSVQDYRIASSENESTESNNQEQQLRNLLCLPIDGVDDEETVSVSSLVKLVRDPIRFYANETLGIYMREDDHFNSLRNQIVLSPLEAYKIRVASSDKEHDQLIEIASQFGAIPSGSFKGAATAKLKKECALFSASFEKFQVKPSSLFSIHFHSDCEKVERDGSGNWIHPPVQIGNTVIEGVIENLSSEGVISFGRESTKDVLKNYVVTLLLKFIDPSLISVKPQVIYIRDEKTASTDHPDPHNQLTALLQYRKHAKRAISPLMPQLAPYFFSGEQEKFIKVSKQLFEEGKSTFSDPYLEWINLTTFSYPASEIYASWEPLIRETFTPFYKKEVEA